MLLLNHNLDLVFMQELRLAETIYKYSYAYISESSQFTFLPFDTQ